MNNERSGRGEFFWPNGVRFVGEYKLNCKSGKGRYFFGSDEYIEGVFKDGKLVDFNNQNGDCTFFTDNKYYSVSLTNGTPDINQTVSSVTRGSTAPVSRADRDNILRHLSELLDKVCEEEDYIEYVGESIMVDPSFIQ